MKFTKKCTLPSFRTLAALSILSVTALSTHMAKAIPYASGITNTGSTYSFILNEDADNVKVIYDGGGAGNTNNLGLQTKGAHTFSLAGHTTYSIQVTRSAPTAWTITSADTNAFCEYPSPRGLKVNRNPADLTRF